MREFTIFVSDFRDVLKFHAKQTYIVSFEQGKFKFSNVNAICIFKRKQKTEAQR